MTEETTEKKTSKSKEPEQATVPFRSSEDIYRKHVLIPAGTVFYATPTESENPGKTWVRLEAQPAEELVEEEKTSAKTKKARSIG